MLFIYLILTITYALSQRLPPNSCSNYFQYRRENNVYFGNVDIPYDQSKTLKLNVNVSLVGIWNNAKLRLQMLTPQSDIAHSSTIKYRIDFPSQQILPKITEIKYNDRVLCSGTPEELSTEGVTNLWSSLTQRIGSVTYMLQPIDYSPRNRPTYTEYRPNLNDYPPRSPDLSQSECGLANNIQSLIVNGYRTIDNEFPWLTALFRRSAGTSYIFQCTANLISPNYVITAAHCVQYYRAPLFPKEDIVLVLGLSNLTHWVTNEDAQIRTASDITIHPDYKQNSGHGDLALIKLNKAITFNRQIRPICLGTNNRQERGIVAGWGKDESGRENVPEARKTTVNAVTQEQCLRSNPGFVNMTSHLTFCAGNRNEAGPCTGDSGAAFMGKINDRWFLEGLVSSAIANRDTIKCNLNEYVVYADITKAIDWIRSVIGQ